MITATSLHLLNVFLSIFISTRNKKSDIDQCSSFLISVLMDSTIGVLIVVLTLRLVNGRIRRYRLFNLDQGNYLTIEGKVLKKNYTLQTVIWVLINFWVS